MRSTFAFLLVLFLVLATSATAQRELNTDRSTLFSGSGNCKLCHTTGSGVNTTAAGEDVSPPSGWRSSMMASAARDPFWQSVVVSESLDHPELAEVIQDKCTNCHIPMGHEESHAAGASSYSLAEGRASALYMEGVSCTLCHQVTQDNFGAPASFSGGYEIAATRVTFGPYPNPLIQPMKNLSGYEPVHSQHMEQAEHCATCHTLFTPYLDKQGQIAGEFPEQTPYLEWKESALAREATTCQRCHMPAREEAMRISTLPQSAPQRTPVFEHHFVGGNTFMLGVIRANADALGATAEDIHFDSTLARTRAQLTGRTAELTSTFPALTADLLTFDVSVRNRTGHKFPTAFPSRRAWLHVTVRNVMQEVVFESGVWDTDGEIVGLDTPYEPHHQLVGDAGQVPIWEAVMGDVDGDPTAQLLHGAQYLKDNRIPPRGYSTLAMASDTIGTVGTDGDDNYTVSEGVEYAGRDEVRYAIPVAPGWDQPLSVVIELCYQSIKPAFIENLARHDAPEITAMRTFHADAPEHVEVIGRLEIDMPVIDAAGGVPETPALLGIDAYPRPLSPANGFLQVDVTRGRVSGAGTLLLVNLLGQVQHRQALPAGSGTQRLQLDVSALRPGMYFLVASVGSERRTLPVSVLP